jgi:CheY-like chemotaxis protein
LGPILNEVLSIMRIRAEAKSLALNVEFLGLLPEKIHTDSTRLCQILLNLVGNAIKFTEKGVIYITISCEERQGNRLAMRFDVMDTGIGITPDQMSRIFEPFCQGDSSTTRRFGGTGLGLTISKRLASILGGDIMVSSVAGKGSTFSLILDVGPLQTMRMTSPPILTRGGVSRKDETRHIDVCIPCRLLLAEDGPDNQRLIILLLKKAGAEVTLAENGLQAMELIQRARREGQEYDAILMDMQMPVMDGYEATQRLREEGFSGPIIAITAHAMAGDRERCLQAGCTDYVSKPIDRIMLLKTVARHIQKSSTCSKDAPRSASFDDEI